MDLIGYVIMPIVKNNRTYLLNLPMGAPYEEAREVFAEAITHIDQIQADAKAKADEDKAAAEQAPIDPEVVGVDGKE